MSSHTSPKDPSSLSLNVQSQHAMKCVEREPVIGKLSMTSVFIPQAASASRETWLSSR